MRDRYSGRNVGQYNRGRSGRSPRPEGGNEFSDSGRQEGYFGGGRQGFGEGYSGSSSSQGYEPSWRSAGSYGRDDREYGNRSYGGDDYSESPYSREGFDREYGRDQGRFGSQRGGYYSRGGREDYSQRSGSYNDRGYGGYTSPSERGYPSDREDDRGWWDRASDEVASWFGDEQAERRRDMDARQSGDQYRGRGPRNYQRSDERIKEDINDRLTDNSFIDAENIEVEVSGREVVLTGTVNSRYEKRLAEDLAEDVSGVTDVENRLKVKRNTGEYAAPSYQGSTTTSNQGGLEALPAVSPGQSRTASSGE